MKAPPNTSLKKQISSSLLLFISSICLVADGSPRTVQSFDENWQFARYGPLPDGDTRAEEKGIEQSQFKDANWRKLNLPHDWAIEGPFNNKLSGRTGKLPYGGIGWYRKHFPMAKKAKNQRHFINFDGAMSHPQVWVNGKKVGEWAYGYSSFRFELTDSLVYGGDNVIAVRLDNPYDSSRWYPGGGIYRHVHLISTDSVHLAQWGTFVRCENSNTDEATVKISSEVRNQSKASTIAIVSYQILDGKNVIESSRVDSTSIAPGKIQTVDCSINLKQPKLWSVDVPHLYLLRTTVTIDGKVVDQQDTSFGVRTVKFTVKDGFHLNGKRVQLQGVCMHHDLGPLGTATNRAAIARQIRILKSMGCNAIRFSHNMPSTDYLNLCDKMGMMALDESFDCWAKGKTRNDYGKYFKKWHERDLRGWVRRDRNHPSVIAWSTGNEISEFNNPKIGIPLSNRLREIVREEDPTRPVTNGVSRHQATNNGMAKTLDIFGINYEHIKYDKGPAANPDMPFFGSETSSTVSSRGVYAFPPNSSGKRAKNKGLTADLHVSSFDFTAPPWAHPIDHVFHRLDAHPNFAGEFVWTGFDYLGEPTPFNKDPSNLLNFETKEKKQEYQNYMKKIGGVTSRSSYFGIVDLCGFPKDRFYQYRSRWLPNVPTVHILPHWSWPERVGKKTAVHVYTNADEVELFVNGKSQGKQKRQPSSYRIQWNDVVYQPGKVKAVGYRDGKEWARETIYTTGEPQQLLLSADRREISADGYDLSFVTVTIADRNGLQVPRSMNNVTFSIEGPGEIVAVGNGDQNSHEPFQSTQRKAFNGLALVIVRSKAGERGPFTVKASSDDLREGSVIITGK